VAPRTVPLGIQRSRPRDDGEAIASLAYKLSYAGALLLTADRIWRSVDSVLDSMCLEGSGGEEMRLVCEPASRGFEVTLRVTRPIDF
jgi:hypothetical protein